MNYQVSPEERDFSGLFGRTKLFSICLVMLCALSTQLFAQSPEIRNAFRLIDIEQPTKGMAALEQAAQANPANLYYLGLGYIKTGQLDKALATFEKGISANEKDALSHAGKGHVKMLEKNPTEAKTHFDKALSLTKSKKADVLKAVGRGYLADSKFLMDALNVLNKAKSIDNGDPQIHILLGDAYLMQNNGGESVSSYERAARADSKLAEPHYKIAKVYLRSKNNDIAVQSLKKAVSVDPEYAPAYMELGDYYYVQKQADEAVKAIEPYLNIVEDPSKAKFKYAFFLFMAKDFEKANAIFKEVLSSDNASATALKYYAYSLIEQDKNEEARKVLDQYFQKAKPEELQASDYAYYGKLLMKLDEDSLANEVFAQSLALDSLQPDILQLQGDSFLNAKKYDKAIESYKQLMSIRQQPLSQDLWSIGRAYYFNQQFAEADTAFTQLAERQPNMTIGYLWAARSRSSLDPETKEGLAKPMYESFIEKALPNEEKNKKDLIEAYNYLAYYNLLQEDIKQAKSFIDKILVLDPNNEPAKNFIKEMNKPAQKG